MRGLEVRSRPIFFDYSPGESMMPVGKVDLHSMKSAPWVHTCGEEVNNPSSDKVSCMNNDDTKQNDILSSNANTILASGQRYFFEVTLTLPESEINKQLGVFMVRVDLKSSDRSLLASSKQHSMLPFESTMVALFRKFMMILPLASGLLSETRSIHLLCFDKYVDLDGNKPMSLVDISLGVPNPAAFPATLQTIQIHSAELRYGKEMNAIQTLLRNWRYFSALSGTMVLFLGYTFIALYLLHRRAQRIRWNTQPYADFFESDEDESVRNSNASSGDMWTGADIEILEEDGDDSDAWEPIDSSEENESSKETKHPTKKSTHNNLVSDDESFVSSIQDVEGRKGPNTAFPLGKLTSNPLVKDHEPFLAASKPKGKNKDDEGASDGERRKNLEAKISAQEKEEKCLADMVMKGHSKWDMLAS